MKVLVLGGGGREHALAWTLHRESGVDEVLCAPGNPGIASCARTLALDILDPAAVTASVAAERVDLVVVAVVRKLVGLVGEREVPIAPHHRELVVLVL